MALPNYYKLHIFNDTGETLAFGDLDTIDISGLPWKRGSDGSLTYGSPFSLFSTPGANVVDQAEAEGSELDNTVNLYEGLFCTAALVATGSPDGDIPIYWEWSQGGGAAGYYPSDAPDFDAARMDTDLVLAGVLAPEGGSDDRVSTNFVLMGPC